MASHDGPAGMPRKVFVVEDEMMIRMLLEDMLSDLGYSVAGVAGRVDEATPIAKDAEFDLAILDVNLGGENVFPIADILIARGVPFVFSTGYNDRGLPEAYRGRPMLQKPFQLDGLDRALSSVISAPQG